MNIQELRRRIRTLRCRKDRCCDRDNCNNPMIFASTVLEIIDDIESKSTALTDSEVKHEK